MMSKKDLLAAFDQTDPKSMSALVVQFLEWLLVKNYSKQTVRNRRVYLKYFIRWCEERGILRPQEVTKPILERYQRYLYYYRKENGQPLSFGSQHAQVLPVRAFFKWLARGNHILYNPASEIEMPKLEKRLPKYVLTVSEAEQILNVPMLDTDIGLRDRAILEVLYSTGIRRVELINLRIFDIDADRETVVVRQGKGKKDRMIPIARRTIDWIEKYVVEARDNFVVEPDNGTLFLTTKGQSFVPQSLSRIVRNYIDAAEIGKTGSCHLFRHTMATLMLEGGSDIRFVQQMLGHSSLLTTQIYTQVSIRKLKQIHKATHPACLERRDSTLKEPPEMSEELFAVLDKEASEDGE